jgi:hypothetical protein
MDGPDVTTITVRPTAEFAEVQGPVMVRAWNGTDCNGAPVVALIAAVRSPATLNMPDLVPIPPPHPEWPEEVTAAMGRLWQVAGLLQPDEAAALAAMASLLTRFQDLKHRRDLATAFLTDVQAMIDGRFW